MWAHARFELKLSDEDWLDYTPKMIQLLSERRLAEVQLDDIRVGRLTCLVSGVFGGKLKIEDVVTGNLPEPAEADPEVKPIVLLQKFSMFAGAPPPEILQRAYDG